MTEEKGLLPSNFETKSEDAVRRNFSVVDGTNYLLINTGIATRDQVENVLDSFIMEAQNDLGKAGEPYFQSIKKNVVEKSRRPTPSRETYLLNLFSDHDGVFYGYGYAFIGDQRLFNLLLGRNADGSKRVRVEDVETDLDVMDPTIPWSAFEVKEIPLGYVYQIGRFDYTEDQRKMLTLIANNIVEPERRKTDPTLPVITYTADRKSSVGLTAVPLTGTITIEVCGVNKPDPEVFQSSVLFSSHIPSWVTENFIKDVLSPFSRSISRFRRPEGRADRRGYQRYTEESYPAVNITTSKMGNRKMFVNFDPNTNDALFALYMIRRLQVIQPGTENIDHVNFSLARNMRGPPTEIPQRSKRAQTAKEVIRAMTGSGINFVPGAISRALYQLVDIKEVESLKALPSQVKEVIVVPEVTIQPVIADRPSIPKSVAPKAKKVTNIANAFAALGIEEEEEVEPEVIVPAVIPTAKVVSSRRRK